VTGAARGIGAGIAAHFVASGSRVALLDLDGPGVEDRARGLGEAALPYAVDLRDPDAVAKTVAEAVRALGGLDVVVNNAGVFAHTPLLDIPISEWDDMFAVNVRAMLLVIQAAVPAMIRGGGRIVNMASMAAKLGTPGEAHYAASKAAVVALTRIAAKELAVHGITVNCVCPGYVLTEMGAATRTADDIATWSALSPLGRLATVQDVVGVVSWLASDDASYCTGQAINVTGGMVMH
jgi:NAD(P)-dependent dehydrogenase (short-subunit alcohol dehydrogenase family)